MTVEKRAEKAVALMIDNRNQPLINVIAEILRDQIEDCAKVADGRADLNNHNAAECLRSSYKELEFMQVATEGELIADLIRALAAPKEEGKENER